MKILGSPGAGLSVRPAVPLEGAVPLWHSLQSPVCLRKVRPDGPSRSLPDWAVLLSQKNSKGNLPEFTCSLAVPYLFSGLNRDWVWFCLSLGLLSPGVVASLCPGRDAQPLPCYSSVLEPNPAHHDTDPYQLIRAAEIWNLRMDCTTKGIRNLH